MKKTKGFFSRRILLSGVLAGMLLAASSRSWASCTYRGEGTSYSSVIINIPTLVVNQDTKIGTVIHTSDENGTPTSLSCNVAGTGLISQGYLDATLEAVSGMTHVYKTNVPGIGIHAGWANSIKNDPTKGYDIYPWHPGSARLEAINYDLQVRAVVQVVVIGPVTSGVIEANKFNAEWWYDGLTMAQLRFNPTTINVISNTCDLVTKNIQVQLKPISSTDIDKQTPSDIVSADDFKIQLINCKEGIQLDYMLNSAGSTGISGNNDILNIASGAGAAEGVGIQILDSQNRLLTFDQEYEAVASTINNQSVDIPLKARYIKTGPSPVKGGEVNATATFTIYYR